MALVWLPLRAQRYQRWGLCSLAHVDTGLLMAVLLLGGLFGARAFYALYFPQELLQNPLGFWVQRGGLVWYGGILGGVAALWAWSFLHRQSPMAWLALLAPILAAGLAIGRLGCFLSGCCYGGPCPYPWLAVHYPHGHASYPLGVYPAPLFEALLSLGLVAFLLWVERTLVRQSPGRVIPTVIGGLFIGLGLNRFALECLRGDTIAWLRWDFGFTTLAWSASQCMSIGVVALGLGVLFWRRGASRLLKKPHHGR